MARVSPHRNGEMPIRHRSSDGPRLAAILLGAVLLLAVPLPAVAVTAEETGTSVEAWYRGSLVDEDDPLCVLPCPELAAPEGPQPENTLHVGVSGGRETARTYFTLDLSRLPSGSTVTGGTVRLPVAGADAGTTTPELAELVACAVDGSVQPAQGGPPSDAPPVDCSRSAPLQLDDDGEVFTFDLAPLTTADPAFGDFPVAVIASDRAHEEAQTWRVAFHSRDRDTDDAEPITARIRYRSDDDFDTQEPGTDDGGSEAQTDPVPPPPDDGAAPVPSLGSGQSSAPGFGDPPPLTGNVEGDDAVIDEPLAADERSLQPEAALLTLTAPMAIDLAYPQVWLLPMVFMAVGGLLTRSLSQGYAVDLDEARR